MTLHHISEGQKKRRHTLTPTEVTFGLFSFFCLLLILRNSDVAIEYMSRGLLLCARSVIPSLFPFMVLSELIVSGGIGESIIRRIGKPFCRLFGISESGCCAVLLGMLCGFPIGARSVIAAYKKGAMTKEEAERVLAFSNNPSSAFLISAVGVSLWESRAFGVALYATVLLTSCLTGILLRLLHKAKYGTRMCESISWHSETRRLKGAKLFTEAIKSASGGMLLVCAYVIFFSTLVGTLNLVLGTLKAPLWLSTLLFCVFELSSGVSQASAIDPPLLAALLCAFSAGWSGLSVHCQILSVCDGTGLSLRPYFLSKMLQGILAMLLFAILLYFFPALTIPAQGV